MKFTAPKPTDTFKITGDPTWPSINFQTDATGAHTWNWKITWNTFSKSGSQTTPNNSWDAKSVITNLGGSLTVQVAAGKESASITVKITGDNPSSAQVNTYLSSQSGSAGFDKILEQESKFKHFNAQGEPVRSFDNGYGMAQLTSPVPTYEQVWNWKLNIDGGLNLFAQKRAAAIAYLSQSNRTYTEDQVKYEAVCRWNGGSYHVWDDKAGAWVRNPNILCDSNTGNIGWDMTDTENSGKSESDLHERDKGSYSHPPQSGAHWKYSGVCYADKILG
jgi:hypothetical protein